MKLTRLRLHGFKSFVEPTDFVIEPGLTGVVGPNGCGKSNLVEALRWAMGETSHKSLRAADMDAVIFAGSGNRPARNHAEVVMTIDNADRSAPAAVNDREILEISRRIEREAGSVYRINGRDVRARDVQILFADAATGARSPALVHQGKIGEIIQAKPEQRRRVLEDAAGVAGLHARRHEAELRLKAAETNLTRVEDVIGQLAGQMDGLKKQARQAIRYREVAAKVRKAEAMLFHLRWLDANAGVAEAGQTHDLSVREMAERTREQAEAARIQAIRASELPALREGEARAAAGLQRLTNAREQLDREEERAKERVAELDRRLTQFSADIAREQQQTSDAEVALQRLDTEDSELKEEIKSRVEKRSGVDERVVRSRSDAGRRRAAVRRTDHRARRPHRQAQSARRERADPSRPAGAARSGDRQCRERGAEARAGNQRARRSRGARRRHGDRAAEPRRSPRPRHRAARPPMSPRAQKLEASRAPLSEADKRVQRLETEARTISKLVNGETKNLWPPIIDGITVAKGYEKALGAALGDDLDAPVDPSAPMRWTNAGVIEGDPALPEGVEPLAAHVDAPAELARRLAQIGVVARERGAELVSQLKTGQRLVSPEGDVWRWDGFVAAAHAPTGAARRLAERARLVDIENELEQARIDAGAKRQALETAEAELKAASAAEAAAREAWRAAQREADAARERHAATEREINRHAARKSALTEAHSRLNADRTEADGAHQSADRGARRIAAEPRYRDQARRGARRDRRPPPPRGAGPRRSAGAGARGGTRRPPPAGDPGRTQRMAEPQGKRGLADRHHRSPRHRGHSRARRTRQCARLVRGEAPRADQRNRSGRNRPPRRRRRAGRRRERDGGNRPRRQDLARGAVERARGHAPAPKSAWRAPGAASPISSAKSTTCWKSSRTPWPVSPRSSRATELPPLGEIEESLEKLRRDRERLGAVNLRAEEELREVEAQHTTLTTERDDLVEAIKRLRQGIQSLNREARERLLTSFEIVNGHFKRLFTELFGGGEAALHLIESDDPLEAGLEIIAKPPGKKPQTLSLLSGGEQALTALALIFAVFLTNPSPICVLDEVDAPLDDHNVERFCNLLDEMTASTETRFIIITHNPITMARMNRLFGVTMAERGVSQLVSVDLEDAVKILDQNVA